MIFESVNYLCNTFDAAGQGNMDTTKNFHKCESRSDLFVLCYKSGFYCLQSHAPLSSYLQLSDILDGELASSMYIP